MALPQKQVIYIHDQIDRIGQLAGEMFYLRNLYPQEEYDVVVITYPPRLVPRVNLAVYDIVMRGLKVAHTMNKKVMTYNAIHKDIPVLEDNNKIYFLDDFKVNREFLKKFMHRKPFYYFSLDEEELEKGEKLREAFCIPKNAPVVVLHVREGGYLPELSYHSYRDASIDNYIPALRYLINKGYYIVRLGDKSIKPIPEVLPQFIDSPFHPDYNFLVEPYFIATSEFYIGTTSGPLSLAWGFKKPVLSLNTPLKNWLWGHEKDLYVFKKYYSLKLKRFLTYEEIITSAILFFNRSEQFLQAGIEIVENTSEEILQAVKEMLARLEGSYHSPLENAQMLLLQNIEEKANRTLENMQLPNVINFLPFYSFSGYEAQISHEFIQMNPFFLTSNDNLPCQALNEWQILHPS